MKDECKQKSKKTSNLSKVQKYEDKTPEGEKKLISAVFPEYYDPSYVESAWNSWLQKEGFFKVNLEDAKKKPRDKRFVMVLPPPNVTGSLHLGHALMGAIEDTIVRYKRLKGCFFMGPWN